LPDVLIAATFLAGGTSGRFELLEDSVADLLKNSSKVERANAARQDITGAIDFLTELRDDLDKKTAKASAKNQKK